MSDPTSTEGRENGRATPERHPFRAAPDADAAEQRQQVVDNSAPAMQRLRTPFEADAADAAEQQKPA